MGLSNGAMVDANGNAITSQVNGSQQSLDVGVNVAGVQVDPRQTRALTSADVVSVQNIAGTVSLPTGAATSANQTTELASLASIDSKLTAPLQTIGARGTFTDRSGTTSGTLGTSTQIIPANASRKYLFIQNNSAAAMWINFTNSATQSQPSIQLAIGASFVLEGDFVSTEAVTAISSRASSAFTAKEA